ncbi:MAG: autotransporter domain-containing protein [Oceanospirillaceae bacterium]|nr:autotransporter domain-containing protein [Oceanospirillaceae bacterium]
MRSAIKRVLNLRIILLLSVPAYAADFTIVDGQTETTTQTLTANENGVIEAGGTLTTAGAGISASGTNVTISNSGIIKSTGNKGIESNGTNSVISNSGAITAAQDGIYSQGADAIITNSGTIAADFIGIASIGSSADVIITNSGTITANEGIYSDGADAVITNSGTITGNTVGIRADGDDVVINNSGKITVTGGGALAVRGDASDSTLNLLAGSQIIGAIDLGDNGGDNDTVNIYGGSVSANLTFINVENINLLTASGFVNGNNVVTVDPTVEAARSSALSGITSSIHNTVNQRALHKKPVKPIQLVAATVSSDMFIQQRTPIAWAQTFGGSTNRDAEAGTLAYDSTHVGLALGYEWYTDQMRVGLFGGVVHSKIDTDTASSQTDADSFYVGGYSLFDIGSVTFSTSILAGYADNNNERLVIDNVEGLEVAKSDFSSVFISPSLSLSTAYKLSDNIEFRPSATINYSMAWLDSYQEQGTTNSNIKVDNRTLRVLTTKAQLAAAYQLNNNSEVEFRLGMSSRHSNDDDTQVNLAGNQFSYANAGDENVNNRFAGINFRMAEQDNLALLVDLEFGDSNKENYLNGQISLEYSF